MLRLLVWAMATGFVSGAVWFAIIFFRRGIPEGGVPEARPLPRNPDPLAPGAQQAQQRSLPASDAALPHRHSSLDTDRLGQNVERVQTPRP